MESAKNKGKSPMEKEKINDPGKKKKLNWLQRLIKKEEEEGSNGWEGSDGGSAADGGAA